MDEFADPEDDSGLDHVLDAAQTRVKKAAGAGSDAGISFSRIADEGDYTAATEGLVTENARINAKVEDDAVGTKLLHIGLVPFGSAFHGFVDPDIASELYADLVEKYNPELGCVSIEVGGSVKEFYGFDTYTDHIGEHKPDVQKRVSVVLGKQAMKTATSDKWPAMKKFINAVKQKLGPSFDLFVGHILFSNHQVCFQYHQDNKDHKAAVDVSLVCELSASKSTMHIAGDVTSLEYEVPGSFFVFDSELWHRSGITYANTIKIALFFTLSSKVSKPDGEEEPASSSASTKDVIVKDEPKVKDEKPHGASGA